MNIDELEHAIGSAASSVIQVFGFNMPGEEDVPTLGVSHSSSVIEETFRNRGSPMPPVIPPPFKPSPIASSADTEPDDADDVILVSQQSPVQGTIAGERPVIRDSLILNKGSGLIKEKSLLNEHTYDGNWGSPVEAERVSKEESSGSIGVNIEIEKKPRSSVITEKQRRLSRDGATMDIVPPKQTDAADGLKQNLSSKHRGKSPIKIQDNINIKKAANKKGKQQQQQKLKSDSKEKIENILPYTSSSSSLFKHLAPFQKKSRDDILRQPDVWMLHPATVRFALRYSEGMTQGTEACSDMLSAFQSATESYDTEDSTFHMREFLNYFNNQVGFIVKCQVLNVGMKNAVRSLKVHISKLKSGTIIEHGRRDVKKIIQNYLEEKVNVNHIIAREASMKIDPGDVILTFSNSLTVLTSLLFTWKSVHKKFRVVVVDSRPAMEGRKFMKELMKEGIPCTYIYINVISYIMHEVTKVFIGAQAVWSNGTIMARVGSAITAMAARAHNVPVVVCCPSFKFHERVQLDAFTQNELGDPKDLEGNSDSNESVLANWEKESNLELLNLKYDLMPAEFVSMLVTELGKIPATSVPVILREQAKEREES